MKDEAVSVRSKRRINSVDLLRGLVMMIMLLDHTREFVHHNALVNDPSNLANTTTLLFFTRWVTHFCAPAFVFLSGVSIYLQKMNGKSAAVLSRFLWTRGLWLILLEFTVVRFLTTYNLDYSYFGMAQVIWVIGVSMIVMAAAIRLSVKANAAIGLAMIMFHNLLDGFALPPNITFAGTPAATLAQDLWMIFHQPGIVSLFGGATKIFFAYPLIPWIGVMMAGYALGSIYELAGEVRRRYLLFIGIAACVLFVVIRFINIYGDPQPWAQQASAMFTFLSFLNTTKYPPSLLFLLMTLGPSMIVLSLADQIRGESAWQRVCVIFGRVPMFFYLLQWVSAHTFGVALNYFAGVDVSYLFLDPLSMGAAAPPNHGFSIWIAYLAWISGLVLLFPLCRLWSKLKQQKKHWVFSYL